MEKTYKNNIDAGGSLKNKTGGWRTFRPVVDKSRCINCATCASYCPEGCILHIQENIKTKNQEIKSLKGEYYEADPDYCKGCGICAQVCPVKCIMMEKQN